MHTMKGHAMPSHTLPARAPRIALAPVAALALLGLPGSWVHAQGSDHDAHHTETPAASGDSTQDLSEGEVTRSDARSGKIALRHGELKNLAMTPMTMVFTWRDPAQAATFKPGDKVRFRAERVKGVFVVTHIEPLR